MSRPCGGSPPTRPGAAGDGDRHLRQPGVRGHARGRRRGGRRLAARDVGDPARGRRARPAPRRRAAPRDAGQGVGLLHLQRPGAGHRPGASRRPARPVHRPRHAPRRRGRGDLVRRSRRADRVVPRERPVPVPGDRVHRRPGGGRGRGHRGQRAARAIHGGDGVAGRGAGPDPDPRGGVRARRRRLAARRRHARLGPARAPAGDDDGDGGGGAAGRPGGAPVGGRSMARDGRRRVRRVPGGAAGVGADVAGRGASRGAAPRRRPRGGTGGRPRRRRSGRRGCRRPSRTRRTPGVRSAPSRRPRRRQSLEILARVRAVVLPRLLRAGRGPRLVVRHRRRRAVLDRARQCPGAGDRRARGRRAVVARRGRAGRQPVRRRRRPGPCSLRRRGTGRGSWARSPGRRWSAWRSRPRTASSLALGVAPAFRRRRAGRRAAAVARRRPSARDRHGATVGVAERDWVEPLDIELRQDIARRLLAGAGFELRRPSPDLARDDPWAVTASLGPG